MILGAELHVRDLRVHPSLHHRPHLCFHFHLTAGFTNIVFFSLIFTMIIIIALIVIRTNDHYDCSGRTRLHPPSSALALSSFYRASPPSRLPSRTPSSHSPYPSLQALAFLLLVMNLPYHLLLLLFWNPVTHLLKTLLTLSLDTSTATAPSVLPLVNLDIFLYFSPFPQKKVSPAQTFPVTPSARSPCNSHLQVLQPWPTLTLAYVHPDTLGSICDLRVTRL